jgi:FixJ family two-component response regulator
MTPHEWHWGRLLQADGFQPALFDSAETFIAAELNCAPLCVIVDMHLPGMSGVDLQDRFRRQQSAVPVIVMTADTTQSVRERAERNGCAAFLSKPFSADAIMSLFASLAPSTV